MMDDMQTESLKQIMPAVDAVVGTIDAEGNSASSPELSAAIAALDARQKSVLGTAIAMLRACRARSRPIPNERMVGRECGTILERLSTAPASAVDVLSDALDLGDLNRHALWEDGDHPPAREA